MRAAVQPPAPFPTHVLGLLMERSLSLIGAVALSIAACDAPPLDPAAGGAPTPRAEQAAKPGARRLTPSIAERVVEKTVVWPAASAVDPRARGRFAAIDLETVDASGVPVLAPTRGIEAADADEVAPFARATVVAQPEW